VLLVNLACPADIQLRMMKQNATGRFLKHKHRYFKSKLVLERPTAILKPTTCGVPQSHAALATSDDWSFGPCAHCSLILIELNLDLGFERHAGSQAREAGCWDEQKKQ
jgi:hypothetical protein